MGPGMKEAAIAIMVGRGRGRLELKKTNNSRVSLALLLGRIHRSKRPCDLVHGLIQPASLA
jgi:hypothetical protein